MNQFHSIEKKWQKRWEDAKIFRTEENDKGKFYCLEMFPYPSGSGLHMGHAFNYTIGDIHARFKRMNGFNVLYPMGYDSFGLPAENAAIKAHVNPKDYTEKSIANFISQQKSLGLSYDWERMVSTCTPEYYRWNQFLFLEFMKNGLVYRKKAPVNWCPKCDTVLANEQVHDGRCWRHTETEVEKKELEQWFIRTSKYAEELLEKIPELEWPERIKTMQQNWIGKSVGVEILFKLENTDIILPAYTTRCDTIYSVTFLVLAPEHPLAKELVKGTDREEEFNEILNIIKKQSIIERTTAEGKDKLGCFLGKYAINPINNEKIPVYIANFALMDYGTGIVMADAHDQRDFEFAKKYDIPLKFVISSDGKNLSPDSFEKAFTDDGILFNSGNFSGISNREALPKMADWIEENNWGKKTIQYKLRDWLVSRQRYWGTPIPIVYCDKCGIVPAEIPVLLPENVKFGKGNPLETDADFVNAKCPKCDGNARRETDTMDTFFDSSWYFLRYCDSRNENSPFDKNKVKYWMPVDQYIGGAEHACMHLIYARFFVKALRDMGYIDFDEPFRKLFNQGMLHGEDGHVMSKSRGNVVLPESVSKKYGIDTARFFLTSIALPDKDLEWSDTGIEGSLRFMKKVVGYFETAKIEKSSSKTESKLNKTIKGVTEDIESFRYNLAIIKIRVLFDSLNEEESKDTLEKFLKLLHPFCPHTTEELWEKIGNNDFLSLAPWPAYDEDRIDESAEILDNAVESTRKDIIKVMELAKIEKPSQIILIISPAWKFTFYSKLREILARTRNPSDMIKDLMATELKQYSKDIMKIIPNVVKDSSKMPLLVLSQEKEFEAYSEAKENLGKEFTCKVEIVLAESSSDAKASNAMPLKPAIVIR